MNHNHHLLLHRAPQPTPTTAGTGVSPTSTSNDFPVFPNNDFISRFYVVSASKSGLTNLDTDLYNRCYLPANPLDYLESDNPTSPSNLKRKESWISITIENPDYETEEAPCTRQGAINTNCYFRNTNGSASGLEKYENHFDEQQHCFCNKYPFFDSVLGCQKCFEMHGGIQAYHWYPESYVSALADAYCSADPPTKEFYSFVSEWKADAAEAKIPSTTAVDVLGTQTAASLYYTAVSKKASSAIRPGNEPRSWMKGAIVGSILCIVLT